MSGFFTGPELSRDAVKRGLLAEGDVVVVHAPRKPNSEIRARLKVVCLSSVFFMPEGNLRERILAIAREGFFSAAREVIRNPSFEGVATPNGDLAKGLALAGATTPSPCPVNTL